MQRGRKRCCIGATRLSHDARFHGRRPFELVRHNFEVREGPEDSTEIGYNLHDPTVDYGDVLESL
jgi:hypothetical protein